VLRNHRSAFDISRGKRGFERRGAIGLVEVLAVGVMALVFLSCRKDSTPTDRAAASATASATPADSAAAKVAALGPAVRAKIDRLKQLAPTLKPPPKTHAPSKELGIAPGNYDFASPEQLDKLIAGNPTDPTESFAGKPPWWMASEELGSKSPDARFIDSAFAIVTNLRYLIVLQGTGGDRPVVKGNQYIMGTYVGRLDIFDVDTGKYEGSLDVKATSSKEVTVWQQKGEDRSQSEIDNDFDAQVKSAIRSAVVDAFPGKL
jgi:hypothetical protein